MPIKFDTFRIWIRNDLSYWIRSRKMRIRIQECKTYPQKQKKVVLWIRIRDLVLFEPWIRAEKKPDRGSGMNVPTLIFENLFWLKNT
jgi:hypothetical protein